ncbi:hypothetical protein CNBA7460 [Cryptococcus deneoformans B-3501A]|uniref:hypothetical protein n=1 Tax=Cryptococcus deneoformans (strain B-3501A) TaxID=283643 RepID=UPI000042F329|nr:hypothetical protein CNBA7460 [Cryptococcus neoformans var. neoformans B-3501A]EAL22978.1 hypothetical protein CNBA7460 [Cryptococcus neoformans var. neoformans B-3501A]
MKESSIRYDDYVRPYKEVFWPPYETTHQPPKTHAAIKEELARMKAERIAKKTAEPSQTEGTETVQSMLAAEERTQGEGAGETKWNKFGAAGHGRLHCIHLFIYITCHLSFMDFVFGSVPHLPIWDKVYDQ